MIDTDICETYIHICLGWHWLRTLKWWSTTYQIVTIRPHLGPLCHCQNQGRPFNLHHLWHHGLSTTLHQLILYCCLPPYSTSSFMFDYHLTPPHPSNLPTTLLHLMWGKLTCGIYLLTYNLLIYSNLFINLFLMLIY